MPHVYPDLIFTAQSAALRVWAGTLDPEELASPSSLPGWTVADLLAHLVAVHDAVAGLRPAPNRQADGAGSGDRTDGTGSGDRTDGAADPLTVAEYVTGYAGDADRVAQMARSIAQDTAGDPLRAWDDAAAQARQTLGALGAADRLVTTRRGQMLASAYLTTRIIELVVHADDLHRSAPHRPAPPVLPAARQHVFGALREVLTARSADPAVLAAASDLDQQVFVDLATGRRAPEAELPEDLAAALPLL
jgi:uncharacterized protein (TIGR03083 family)